MSDGATRKLEAEDIEPGIVIRSGSDSFLHSFADTIVLGWAEQKKLPHGRTMARYVKIARPYAYITLVDTTCPAVLMGVEQFEISVDSLCRYYRIVLMSDGKPAKHVV